jgi:hypothetical protein
MVDFEREMTMTLIRFDFANLQFVVHVMSLEPIWYRRDPPILWIFTVSLKLCICTSS